MERVRQKKAKVPTITEGIQRQRSLPKLASECSSYSTTEEDLFSCELWRSSSRRVTGTPIKKLLAEEMSKETESKRRPPSVIAKLMGLDGLPPRQPLHRQHKGFSETYRQRTAPLASQRDAKPYERILNRKNSMDQKEFKDVYEVLETSKVERGSYPAKGTVNSKLSEAEMAFIQQKFMDVKRLSTNDRFHNSKEFCDMLDMLDDNKDLLMKFLQQPDSLFTKHLLNLQGVAPRSKCSHIAVIKPSNLEKFESTTIGWKSEKETLRCSHQKHYDGLSTHSYNHRAAKKSHKSSKIELEGKHESEREILPTRIVVLKPNPEKVQNATKSVLSTCSSRGNLSDCRKHGGYQSIGTDEGGPWVKKNLSNDAGFLKPKSGESREIAKEIMRRMRETFRSEPMDLSSTFRGYAGDESSYDVSGSDSGSESELTMPTFRKSFHWSNRPKPSSWHSIESSESREAKKRLSERWKMSQRYQDIGAVGKGSTLGEMLAIPNTELRPENFDPMTGLDGSSDRFASNDEIAEWDSPLGISSRDGWKDRVRISSRSTKAFPASSVSCGGRKTNMQCETFEQDSYLITGETMNQSRNKAIKRNFNKKEDSSSRKLRSDKKKSQSSRCTYSDSTDSLEEKQFNLSQMEVDLGKKDPLEEKSLVSEMPTDNFNGKSLINNAEADGGHEDMIMCSESPDEWSSKPSSCLLGNSNSSTPGPEDSKAQVPDIGPSEEESVQLQCPVPEPQSPASSKEADHPSPVSVLEAPFVEDVSSGSKCFESVSADLHELRVQLKLLKMESGVNADEGKLMSSDKNVIRGFVAVLEEEGMFKDESWESFYLVDVLIDSGYDDADPDLSVSTWYSPDCPLDPRVFDNLEKKYCNEATQLRSERRLLFDRINSGLFEMFHQWTDPQPWVKLMTRKVSPKWQKHGISYELHKLLAIEEKKVYEDVTERVLDREMQWLDFGDDIDVVGREIEKLLIDDLIAEVANM